MPTFDNDSLHREITNLSDRVDSKDKEVSTLINLMIQTSDRVSDNLVKLTQVVSNVTVLERTQEEQQRSINDIKNRVAENEVNIKLSLLDKQHIKQSLEEIKTNQKEARAMVCKVFSAIVVLAIVGGITAKFI